MFAITMLGTTLPTPLYGLYQNEFGFSAIVLTILFSTYSVGVIVALLVLGGLSDRVGRRPMLMAALGFSAASAVVFLVAGTLPVLFLGRALSGFSAGIATGTGTAAVMELAPGHRRGAATFVATAANMLGLGSGPLLAGLLAQFAGRPLRLPYAVDLCLIVLAFVACVRLPETAAAPGRTSGTGPRRRIQRLGVPDEARAAFVPAAIVGFAGFATFGVFTSVAPSFITTVLGQSGQAIVGLLVFAIFAASTGGQLAPGILGLERALQSGCGLIVAGMALLALALAWASLPLFVLATVLAGAGQGMSFRAGIAAVARTSPPERRGETNSSLFVVLYVGTALPVVGVGALEQLAGLRTAGIVFTGFVAVLAIAAAARLLARPVRLDG